MPEEKEVLEKQNIEFAKHLGIEYPNCRNCALKGSDGDGPEYNGTWDICTINDSYSNLISFPFKKAMSCWCPEFWVSKFPDAIKERKNIEIDEAYDQFQKACTEFKIQLKEEMGRCLKKKK